MLLLIASNSPVCEEGRSYHCLLLIEWLEILLSSIFILFLSHRVGGNLYSGLTCTSCIHGQRWGVCDGGTKCDPSYLLYHAI